jgi:hypothetical protein
MSVAKHAHPVDARTADMGAAETTEMRAGETADMGAAETTEMRAGETADMTASKVAAQTADMSAAEAADMAAAEAATTPRESSTTSRGHSNHHGCGDCKNFSVHQSFHVLFPFLLVPCLIRRTEDRFSETLIQDSPETQGSRPKESQCKELTD